jgi:hypothetical protein
MDNLLGTFRVRAVGALLALDALAALCHGMRPAQCRLLFATTLSLVHGTTMRVKIVPG